MRTTAAADTECRRFRRPMDFVRLGFPRTRLYRDLAEDRLRHLRVGRSILIAEEDFEAYLGRFARTDHRVAA